MSVATEITRIENAKSNIKTAIENKGVSVPNDALIDTYATYISQISGGSSGLTYETGTYTPTNDIARPTIAFTNVHNEAPIYIGMFDVTDTSNQNTNTNYCWEYFDHYKMWGTSLPYASDGLRYAFIFYYYRSTSTTATTTGWVQCSNNSDSSGDGDTSYPRYWVTETDFKPSSNSTTRYWRASRTYKWIAIWK